MIPCPGYGGTRLEQEAFSMSIRWILVAIAALVVTDCGSGEDTQVACGAGDVMKEVCTKCGPTGGCGQTETKCAKICSEPADCQELMLFCSDGVCQVAGCI